MDERIAVIGLGYVGLPVALAFGRQLPGTIGLDIDAGRVAALRAGHDRNAEVAPDVLKDCGVTFTTDAQALTDRTFFIIAVPTPIDARRQPELTPLIGATKTVASVLRPGAVVVYESTVFPGCTEEVCGPLLEQGSGLTRGVDFTLGYSPERINPGDREHTIEKVVKVVAGENEATRERVARAYESIVRAGVHRAPSLAVAETAKVIENTQRDLNIALMNEIALICDRLGIRTADVLAAARTKWNFLPFSPGLVGGHCIGVDPYYLTFKAEALGYHPEVILAGRRINDRIGVVIAQRFVKLLRQQRPACASPRVAVLGLTFKENVSDLRNSRAPEIVHELREFGIEPIAHDPLADPDEARRVCGVELVGWDALSALDGLIVAVAHRAYRERLPDALPELLVEGAVIADIKSMFEPACVPAGAVLWSL